ARHDGDLHQSIRQFHGQRDRKLKTVFDARLHQQPVNYNFNGVILALVETDLVFQVDQYAVDAGAGEAVLRQLFHFLFEHAFAAAHDGREDHDAIFRRELHDALHDLFGRLAGDFASALWTMRHSNRGIEQAQIVVDLSDGSHGGAGATASGFLLDRNAWAQT